MAASRDSPSLLLLPVFLLRACRHRLLYVRDGRALRSLADLRGKTFALPDFFNGDALWFRVMLEQQYGVDPREVRWLQYGSGYGIELPEPRGYELVRQTGRRPYQLVEQGLADVAYVLAGRDGTAARGLQDFFADGALEERSFVERTGVFPIMHAFVVRGDICQQHPSLPEGLFKALVEARNAWYRQLEVEAASLSGLPWETLHEARAALGWDFWPYGIADNRRALEAAARRLAEDGLIGSDVDPAAWFVEELRWT
jgi:4,5-dihydroxyphthalate decarboxylase